MKTRNEIYQGEGAKLLRFITTYHTLRYDQVLQLFSRHEQSIKSLITSLIKQGRIIYDKEHDLLCDSQQSAENPDYAIITCFWVLLDFKKGVVYHTSGEFPIKLNFFSQDEQYEIIYIGEEQEALINHVMESIPSHGSKRLIVLESESQAAKITIDDVAAYCLVNESGAVSYYMRTLYSSGGTGLHSPGSFFHGCQPVNRKYLQKLVPDAWRPVLFASDECVVPAAVYFYGRHLPCQSVIPIRKEDQNET